MFSARTSAAAAIGTCLLLALINPGVPTDPVLTRAAPLSDRHSDPRSLLPLRDVQIAELLLGSLGTIVAFHREELDLSDEQHAKLRAIWIEYEKGRLQAESHVQQARMEVLKLSVDIHADLESLESALLRFSAALVSLQMQSVKTLRALHAIVTPQQLERWQHLVNPKIEQKERLSST